MHTPVLLKQAVEKLNVKPQGKYIDATFGEGGYSQEILKKGGRILAIDLDIGQLDNFQDKKLLANLKLIQGNFKDIEKIAKENDFFPVDGVVFDLGLSMRQLNESKRGFSYKNKDEDLDMRLDLTSSLQAKDLLKKATKDELYEIFSKYSEDLNSEKIAEEVFLNKKRIEKVGDLIKVIDKALGKKDKKTYARIFQALRIVVNNEFENLKQGLVGALNILKKEGRIVVVSFHSLEDRIVKKFVKENHLRFLDKKPIFGEKKFERSAKLRVILKKYENI